MSLYHCEISSKKQLSAFITNYWLIFVKDQNLNLVKVVEAWVKPTWDKQEAATTPYCYRLASVNQADMVEHTFV